MSLSDKFKAIRLFPKINNIKPFLNRSHPILHPESTQYIDYWENEEKKCIEGIWGLDYNENTKIGGYRYMPGNLYYYVNMTKIIIEKGKGTEEAHPYLRDIEWILAYGYLTARGFSGFEDDEEYTCHRIVKKIQNNTELEPKEEFNITNPKFLEENKLLKKDGSFKKYVEAKEYLYKTHDAQLGLPIYGNTALNLFVLSSRGIGKSYFTSGAIIDHEWRFFGKKYYNDDYLINPSPVEIVVGSAIESKSTDLLLKWEANDRQIKDKLGAYGSNLDFYPGFFHRESSGTLYNSNKNILINKYDYKEGNEWKTAGSLTSISHVVFTSNNPQAAVGKRPTLIVVEEVGLMPNVITVHGANETTQIRDNKFGTTVYIGTSGNMDKVTGSKIIFENAKGYDCVDYEDVFEQRVKNIGLFIPGYYVDNSFRDENGNIDVEKAFAQEMHMRAKKVEESGNEGLYELMMARPLVPSEMFLNSQGNIFPTQYLRERLIELENKNLFEHRGVAGFLEYDDQDENKVIFRPDLKKVLNPIVDLNLENNKDTKGAVVIYEQPTDYIEDFRYKNTLYKVVYDPVKDKGGGTSLCSILVYKGIPLKNKDRGLERTIVAEYIGRLDRVYDMHEIAIKLAKYYNCPIMPEINLPGFEEYCELTNNIKYIQEAPIHVISKNIKNPSSKTLKLGVYLTKELSIAAEQLGKQWLLEPRANEEGKIKRNLDYIYSPRLLKELINYTRDGNFDHVSSFKILMLWLAEELESPVEESVAEIVKEEIDEFMQYIKDSKKLNKSVYGY
jgi:hypothetical protein